jgi:hypothetical protein
MGGLRALKILTVVMGVMIIGGTVTLAVLIVHRLAGPAPGRAAERVLQGEPAGTRIAGIAATQDRLAVRLTGGGPDRILLLDPHSLATLGRIALSP